MKFPHFCKSTPQRLLDHCYQRCDNTYNCYTFNILFPRFEWNHPRIAYRAAPYRRESDERGIWSKSPYSTMIASGRVCIIYFSIASMLTHWDRDQIDAISQTTFSNAFPRMKMNRFRLGFDWSLFLSFELTISEPMMVSLLHICVTRPQCVNSSRGNDWRHCIFICVSLYCYPLIPKFPIWSVIRSLNKREYLKLNVGLYIRCNALWLSKWQKYLLVLN